MVRKCRTCLHIEGDDLGLNGGLSLTLEKSEMYERTGHPCRLDFERFGELIQCIRILNPQKSLMTENDRDLNDRNLWGIEK